MARRAQGVRKDVRTGRYQARCSDAHGRRASKTFARQKDAVDWLQLQQSNRMAEELGKPPIATPQDRPLFKDFAADWLEKQLPEWSKASRLQAERIVGHLRASQLGAMTVDEIDFRAVEAYLVRISAQKKKGKSKELVSYYEVRNHLVYLRRITKRMQVEYSLPIWACETIRLTKDVRQRRGPKRAALTPVQLGAFLDALDGPKFRKTRWRALFWALACTGMRPAEVLALRRNRIDFTAGRIIVNASAYRNEVRETTKTGAGREPGMAPELAAVLEQHLKLFPTLPAGFLFPARTGGIRGGDTLAKPFRLALKEAKIETAGLTPYSLRNTFNSVGESIFGASLALRDTLGHVGTDMTELYFRASAEDRAKVAIGILDAVRAARPSAAPFDAYSGSGRSGRSESQ